MMEFPVIPTPNPAKVARMMDITACKCSCAEDHCLVQHTMKCYRAHGSSDKLFMLAYISVEEVGEEDDEEELDRRVDPHVPS
jgi:hypothetical protein